MGSCAVQQLPRELPSRCPKCDGVPRLYLRLPNAKNQSTVYVYRCVRCATLIWVDEYAMVGSGHQLGQS
jgi:hypothetical protein